MHILGLLSLFSALGLNACGTSAATISRIAARNVVTDNIFNLTVHEKRARPLQKRVLPFAPTQDEVTTRSATVYMASVKIGDQQLYLVIDTGTVGTWVASTDFICLDSSQKLRKQQSDCMFGKTFDPTASSTFRKVKNHKLDYSYAGSEFVKGIFAQEQFTIGGLTRMRSPHPTFNQIIGIAEKGHWEGDLVSGGLLGLGFVSSLQPLSVLQTLFQETSTAPIFSLAFERSSSDAPAPGGFLAFGGIPNIPTDNRWVETPTIPSLSAKAPEVYTINIDGFDITPPSGSSSKHVPGGPFISSQQAVAVDSGTAKIYVPLEISEHIASLFDPAAERWSIDEYMVPCTALTPRVGIKIGGTSYYINGGDLLLSREDLGNNVCELQVAPSTDGVFILGATWLKNVLVAFDMSNAFNSNRRNRHVVLHIAGREKY